MRVHAAFLLLLSISACGGPPTAPLPELPVPKSATFPTAVRDQIDGAYKRAAASPGDAEAVGRYGMILEAYAQYEAARACYGRAHQLDPGTFRWGYLLARAQELGGDRASAIVTLREALKLQSDYLPARLALASMLLASEEAEQSRQLAESALRDAPASAPAHYALGRALSGLRRPSDAAEHLREALRIAPDYAAAHYALALACRDLGASADSNRHMALHQRYRNADPPTDDALVDEVEGLNAGSLVRLRRAKQLYAQNRFPEAAAEYERALAVEGNDPAIRTALVATYLRMNERGKAEAHYPGLVATLQKALAADPDDPASHTQLARVYELMHEPTKAVHHYRLALEQDPRANETRAFLVNVLLADARGREALDEMLPLLVAGDVPPEAARAAVRRAYAKIGGPSQVATYLRDARRRAKAGGHADLVAAIDVELTALESFR